MRIALVTREFPPETGWGGIGAFYASFARSLVEAGHDVEVFSQGLEQAGAEEADGVKVTRVLGLTDAFGVRGQGALAGNDDLGLFALGLARAMHQAVRQRHHDAPFDVIESHEHLGIGALINGDPDIRAVKVTRYHAAYHSLVKRGLVDWPASRLVEALERAAIASADHRISVSASIDRVAQEDFGAPPAEANIPNFVRAPDWSGRWSSKKDQVLFVGRLVLNLKRPDVALEAFIRFARARPGWKLLFVGLDQDHEQIGSVWEHLKASIPAEMRGRIEHLGDQTPDQVFRLMGESKAVLMPSEFESFGLVVVEAMLHGCLPLVTAGAATADVVPDPRLIRKRGSAEDFAAGLETLLGDPRASKAAALSAKVVEHARAAFALDRVMASNLGLYEKAMASRRDDGRPPVFSDGSGPLVSIVVPNFNGERFLDETLASIVSQDYPNIEVILVDGGSTDASMDIAAAWPSVEVIREPDKGQAHAINRGLLKARGDILAYLNSDDLYQPGAVRAVVERFRREPETMILCGGCEVIDEEGRSADALIQPRFSGQQGIIRYWGWGRWHAIPQPATFWRREVTERVGLFDTSLHFAMDLEFWVRAAGLYAIRLAPETLAAFRLAGGTKTVSQTDRMYDEERLVFARYRSRLPWRRQAIETLAASAHHSGKLLGMAEHLYLGERRRRDAARLAIKSVKAFPVRVFDPRLWFLLGNAAASAARLSGLADRVHRKLLSVLPRPSTWGRT